MSGNNKAGFYAKENRGAQLPAILNGTIYSYVTRGHNVLGFLLFSRLLV